MAAEPLPERELAALHNRIGRDVVELRRRMRRYTRDGRGNPDDVFRAVVDTVRMIRALRGFAPGAGLGILLIARMAARSAHRRR